MCNIQFSDGFSIELQYLIFFFYLIFFLLLIFFSSQFLRSLNAFWSWGCPGNLRTYTNAPKTHKMTGFHFSLISFHLVFIFLFFFCLMVLLVVEPGCFFFSGQRRCVTMCPLPCLLLYCYLLHYYVLNWFSLTFKEFWGSWNGLEFLTYKKYRSFVKN